MFGIAYRVAIVTALASVVAAESQTLLDARVDGHLKFSMQGPVRNVVPVGDGSGVAFVAEATGGLVLSKVGFDGGGPIRVGDVPWDYRVVLPVPGSASQFFLSEEFDAGTAGRIALFDQVKGGVKELDTGGGGWVYSLSPGGLFAVLGIERSCPGGYNCRCRKYAIFSVADGRREVEFPAVFRSDTHPDGRKYETNLNVWFDWRDDSCVTIRQGEATGGARSVEYCRENGKWSSRESVARRTALVGGGMREAIGTAWWGRPMAVTLGGKGEAYRLDVASILGVAGHTGDEVSIHVMGRSAIVVRITRQATGQEIEAVRLVAPDGRR